MRDFLGIENPESPLYGRYVKEIYANRFGRETSLGFLRSGFAELGIEVNEDELDETYERLDGIVGWLTLYGYLRGVDGLGHGESLNRVFSDGIRLVLSELDALIRPPGPGT